MTERLTDLLAHLFSFDITADLLRRDFVQQALLAAALLALVSGLIGPFIVMRQMSFAVHGSSELSLTGAAFALLAGFNVGVGALVGCALAAVLFGILGQRARERDSAIGVVLAFGLGLAVLFIHLYPGRTGTSFALLTGQIVGVGYSGLALLAVVSVLVIAVLAVSYRPLLFATVDPEVAAGRGVPVRALGIVFAALVGVTAAQGVQIVGALLVMSLLITPAAAAVRVFVSPGAAIAASVVFAEVSAVGGILLSLAPGVPVSVFVTTISFAIFLVCWLVGQARAAARRRRSQPRSTGALIRTPFGPRARIQRGVDAGRGESRDHDRCGDTGPAVGADARRSNSRRGPYRTGSVRRRPAGWCSAHCGPRGCGRRPGRRARRRRGIVRVPARPAAVTPAAARLLGGQRGQRPGIQVVVLHRDVAGFRRDRTAFERAASRRPVRRRGCARRRCPPRSAPTRPAPTRPGSSRRKPRPARRRRTPHRRAAASTSRPDGSGWRPRPMTVWSLSSSSSDTYTAPGMWPRS